jgi:hypothetical protein
MFVFVLCLCSAFVSKDLTTVTSLFERVLLFGYMIKKLKKGPGLNKGL